MRFRLANLLYLTAVVAIIVCAWARFVRGNIHDIQCNPSGVTIWFSEEWHYWMGMPYYDYQTGELIEPYGTLDGYILLHNEFLYWPWSIVAGAIAVLAATDVALHLIIWRVRRWRRLSIDARNR